MTDFVGPRVISNLIFIHACEHKIPFSRWNDRSWSRIWICCVFLGQLIAMPSQREPSANASFNRSQAGSILNCKGFVTPSIYLPYMQYQPCRGHLRSSLSRLQFQPLKTVQTLQKDDFERPSESGFNSSVSCAFFLQWVCGPCPTFISPLSSLSAGTQNLFHQADLDEKHVLHTFEWVPKIM